MSLERVLQASYGSRLAISGDNAQYTLSYDPTTKSLILTVSTPQANQVIPVSASQDLMSLVIKYGSLRLVTAESGPADAVTFRGVIPTPQPTQVVLTYRFDMSDAQVQQLNK